MKIRKILFSILIVLLFISGQQVLTVQADEPVAGNPYAVLTKLDYTPKEVTDSASNHYYDKGCPAPIVTMMNSDGTMDVCAEAKNDDSIYIHKFNSSKQITDTIKIDRIFPLFGSAAKDAAGNYYLVFGKDNEIEDNSIQNLVIAKYSSAGELLCKTYFDDNAYYGIKYPFTSGSCEVVISGDRVLVHLSRTMFVSNDGVNHQGAYSDTFSTTDLSRVSVGGKWEMPWCSHCFNQSVIPVANGFVLATQGDAYNYRGVTLSKMMESTTVEHNLIPYKGNDGDNYCYSQFGGVAQSSGGYLYVGTYENGYESDLTRCAHPRNIFVQTVSDDLGTASGPIYLTQYTKITEGHAYNPKIVRLGTTDTFVILWEKIITINGSSTAYEGTYMAKIDAAGNMIGGVKRLPDIRLNIYDDLKCNPTTGMVEWVINNDDALVLVSLDPNAVPEEGVCNTGIRVKDIEGTVLTNATVTVKGGTFDGTVFSGTGEVKSGQLPYGQSTLVVTAPGYRSKEVKIKVWENGVVSDIELKGGYIRYFVCDNETEAALEDVQVLIDGKKVELSESEDGRYSYEGKPEGSYQVVFSKDGYYDTERTATSSLTYLSYKYVWMVDRGTLWVKAKGDKGSYLSNFTVKLDDTGTPVSTASGTVTFSDIKPGTHKITISSPGYQDLTKTINMVSTAQSEEVTLTRAPIPAAGITLNKTSATVEKGKTCQLTTQITPANSNDTVIWETSAGSVATVSASGLVTAVGGGNATITARTTSGKTATCVITVTSPATAINLNKTAERMEKGSTLQLTGALVPSDSTEQVNWSSSKTSVATVDVSGLVKAVGKGTTTITATTTSGKTATCNITVVIPATAVNLDTTIATMEKGNSLQLAATLSPGDSTDAVSWESSDSDVATVNESGLIVAVNSGSATITATTESGEKAYCNVTVIITATGLELERSTITVNPGATYQLVAQIIPSDSTDTIVWGSSDDNVATVSADGLVTGINKGIATITALTSSGITVTGSVKVSTPATGVVLDEAEVEVAKGDNCQLSALLTPAESEDEISWESSDADVAKVDENGLITGVEKGSAVITATTTSGQTAECKVVVTIPATAVALQETRVVLYEQETCSLTAVMTPLDSTDEITWASSDASVATVDTDGVITAIAQGDAVITATTTSGQMASCDVIIAEPSTAIELNKSAVTVNKNDTYQLNATLTPVGSEDEVNWESLNPNIATVDANGLVTAVGRGTATITATTKSGESANCHVTVLVPAAAVNLNKTEASVARGNTCQLTAKLNPLDSTDTLTWQSLNPEVATVEASGLVRAINKGTATITATATSGASQSCTITVTVPAKGIRMNKTSVTLNKGANVQLSTQLEPADCTEQVKWMSSQTKVANVSQTGLVTTVGRGSAVITAVTPSGLQASCTLIVKVPSTQVTLSAKNLTLNKGKTHKLTYKMLPTDTTDAVTYSSSNSKVATVTAAGNVKAIGKGTAKITVKTTSGKTFVCSVTVKVPATSVSLNKTSLKLAKGKKYTLKAKMAPSTTTDKVKWTTSNKKIATVSSKGVVKAKKKGTVTITVKTTSGKTKKCKITVK